MSPLYRYQRWNTVLNTQHLSISIAIEIAKLLPSDGGIAGANLERFKWITSQWNVFKTYFERLFQRRS